MTLRHGVSSRVPQVSRGIGWWCVFGCQAQREVAGGVEAPPVAGARRGSPVRVSSGRSFGRLGRGRSLPQAGPPQSRRNQPRCSGGLVSTTAPGRPRPASPRTAEAGPAVAAQVVRAGGAGHQAVRRRRGRARPRSDVLEQHPAQATALQVGGDHQPTDLPLVAVEAAPHARRDARRGARRRSPSSTSEASMSSSDSCSGGMARSSLTRASPHPAGQREGAALAGVGAGGRHDLPRRSATALACSRSGRRSRRTPQRLLAAPGRDRARGCRPSSTAGTSRPRQRGGLGVDGVLQQPVLVGLLHQGLGVAHEARAAAARPPR